MKITNKLNLPAPLVRAIENDNYTPGTRRADYSTTGLLKPPRIAVLSRLHRDEITEDASDRIWSLLGQVTHTILERAAMGELVEKRLYMDIAGKVVSGQVDLVGGTTLTDYKLTTIYKGKGEIPEEWTQQGNINRLLCHENGIEVTKLENVAIYRDFSIMKCQRTADYPVSAPVGVFNLPLWPLEKTRAFVEERIALHEAAKENLPLCTDEERWAKPEKWALMKEGQKRAVKLYDTEEQAEAARLACGNPIEIDTSKKHFIEHRSGESTRCLFFCSAAPWCTQFREMMEESK